MKVHFMNEEQAAQILLETYNEALLRREQVTAIHLFGIKYAEELAALPSPQSWKELACVLRMPPKFARA